VIFIGKKYFLL